MYGKSKTSFNILQIGGEQQEIESRNEPIDREKKFMVKSSEEAFVSIMLRDREFEKFKQKLANANEKHHEIDQHLEKEKDRIKKIT